VREKGTVLYDQVERKDMARFFSRKTIFVLSLVVVLPILLYVFRFQALAGIGDFLVIRDQLEPADIIYILNGDPTVRPYHAAELFGQGLAPKVVIARAEDSIGVQFGAYPNVTDSNLIILKKLGVPETQLVELRRDPGVSTTFDEAIALRDYCRQHSVRKVIVVTSDLHSRRARFVIRRVLSGMPVTVMLSPIADRKYGATNWWRIEDGVIGCQNEYVKLLYYHLKY
jgi:uncharacterized SAM-binding protein YcdF (DUF218 family)